MKATIEVVRVKLTQALGMDSIMNISNVKQTAYHMLPGSLSIPLSRESSSTLKDALPPTDGRSSNTVSLRDH